MFIWRWNPSFNNCDRILNVNGYVSQEFSRKTKVRTIKNKQNVKLVEACVHGHTGILIGEKIAEYVPRVKVTVLQNIFQLQDL